MYRNLFKSRSANNLTIGLKDLPKGTFKRDLPKGSDVAIELLSQESNPDDDAVHRNGKKEDEQSPPRSVVKSPV